MKRIFLCGYLLAATIVRAQTAEVWDLKQCIDYAVAHNISIKQADINARIAQLQADQARYNLLPNVSANTGTGMRFGRSIDPTTNSFATTQFLFQNFGVNVGMQLYNFGRLKNTEQAAIFNAKAALQDVERAAYDISMNVATFYLQILAAKEQTNITKVQISQSLSQLDITRKRVEAGVIPELSLAEIEAQLASDSSNYFNALASEQQNLLNMKGLLNLDPATPFNVVTPPVDKIPLESFADLQPELVYQTGLANQPQQKVNALRIEAAKKNVLVSKSLAYPTLTVGGNINTNFSNAVKYVSGFTFNGYNPVTGFEPIVAVGGNNYFVQNPNFKAVQSTRSFGQMWNGWGSQIDRNLGQNIGLNLSIPIFSNNQTKVSVKQSQLNVKSAELQKEAADLKLKQDIYLAYTNAVTSLQRFNASKKSVETAQKAYDYSLKRYEIGLLGSLDLITNQNSLLRAKLQLLSNQFDYVFRMKLLELYKGQGIKL
ncbi:MAG: TolC family protein [Bacteroidota bacterium]|jgi:outer membrane protein